MSLLRGDGSRARGRRVISRRLTVLAGVVACAMATGAADASADSAPVGHRVENLVVPGSFAGENRKVRVHLWYPAAEAGFAAAPKTEYTSGLNGKPLYPDLWDPLGWKVEAEIARETDAIDPGGAPLPVVVFSHGGSNDPIDYAWTLELIAAEASSWPRRITPTTRRTTRGSTTSTARRRRRSVARPLFECEDGRPSPCARNDAAGRAASRTACATSPTSSTRCPAGSPAARTRRASA